MALVVAIKSVMDLVIATLFVAMRVQRLPPCAGYKRRQLHQRLVVLTGQQQADEVLPQRGALFVAPQQGVELRTELVNRPPSSGRWAYAESAWEHLCLTRG
jgi:hypothetical protein